MKPLEKMAFFPIFAKPQVNQINPHQVPLSCILYVS